MHVGTLWHGPAKFAARTYMPGVHLFREKAVHPFREKGQTANQGALTTRTTLQWYPNMLVRSGKLLF